MGVLINLGENVRVSDPVVLLAAGGTIADTSDSADVTITFPASPVWQRMILNVTVDEGSAATNVDIFAAIAVNGVDFTSFLNVGTAPFLGDFPPSGTNTSGVIDFGQDGLIPGVSLIRIHLTNNDGAIATMAKATMQFDVPLEGNGS